MMRFCYECIHRRIVDGLPNGEYRCNIYPQLKVFDSTDATKCVENGDFEEIVIPIQ